MSKIPYSPDTHFLIDHANLSAPLLANKVTDSFGPVSGSLTTKFRTTSVLRMSAEATVHAICDGHLLIQPQTGDTTKVNLILKPSVSFAPLKVKYFIYRGVKKQDLLNHMTSKIEKIDLALTTQPDLLVKIWTQSINYNSPDHLDLGGSIETPPDEIPAILLGYDPAEPGTTLLDTYFFNDESVNADFQIPKCDKGEWIANVTGKIGLDIVLDTGDYHLDNEEELFKLDMEFARKAENVFDTATITTVNKRKKYKEYIHQFIDAAAFWGSHIDCGSIKLANDVAPKSSASDIFTSVVSKFQTKHKTYLYVKSERGRSYDFYSQYSTPGTGKLNFAPKGTATLVDYNQDGWPIVIKEFTQATASAKNELQFSLDFNIDSQLHEIDQRIVLNAVIPDWNDDNFILDSKLRVPKTKLNTQFNAIDNIPLKNTTVAADEKSIASFMMFSFLGDKKLTTLNYFDDLWKANVKPVFTIASNDNLCEWATINDNQLVDLSPETEINNTRIGLKVVFDNGKNSSNARKKRRLYVASILEVNQEELKKKERRDITVNGLKSGFEKTLTKNNYYSTVYDRTNYDVYKGSIDDSGTTIDTLSLVSNTDYELEDSYLQFGIMEEEYNKLIYDSASVPVSLLHHLIYQ